MFGVKIPDPNFTGRLNELNLLKAATISRQNIPDVKLPIAVVVSGLGGIGKTQLVRKFIHQYRSSYDNVIWINSQGPSSIEDAFKNIAEQHELATGSTGGESLIGEVFDNLPKTSTLIVLDNVDENNSIINILLTMAQPGVRHFVITSRIQEWSDSIYQIKLNVFNERDALEYVNTKLADPKELHKDSFKDKMALVEKLQYFPLALTQAVAYINCQRVVGGFSIHEYMQKYDNYFLESEDKPERILDSKVFQKDQVNLYQQTTLTTWKVTIAALPKCKCKEIDNNCNVNCMYVCMYVFIQ